MPDHGGRLFVQSPNGTRRIGGSSHGPPATSGERMVIRLATWNYNALSAISEGAQNVALFTNASGHDTAFLAMRSPVMLLQVSYYILPIAIVTIMCFFLRCHGPQVVIH